MDPQDWGQPLKWHLKCLSTCHSNFCCCVFEKQIQIYLFKNSLKQPGLLQNYTTFFLMLIVSHKHPLLMDKATVPLTNSFSKSILFCHSDCKSKVNGPFYTRHRARGDFYLLNCVIQYAWLAPTLIISYKTIIFMIFIFHFVPSHHVLSY